MRYSPTRKITIVAQDPGVKVGGRILTAQVDIPNEVLAPGPSGHRARVVDYDSSTDTLMKPLLADRPAEEKKLVRPTDATILGNQHFHAQNAYAIVMRTLAHFEHALGRRVSWSFAGHQIHVVPHAFRDANAFYSRRDRALLFGYFPRRDGKGWVMSCLSHDVVAHETTHALLDGLRERYTDPSSPDQAAFHEGFSDVVALLSVFSVRDVVAQLLDSGDRVPAAQRKYTISRKALRPEKLESTVLLGLALQMGEEISGIRGKVLRRSVELKPSPAYLDHPQYQLPHKRGEILVAAMMTAFVQVWTRRLEPLGSLKDGRVDRERVVEEGAEAAGHLLTMAIRAIDYAPPTDLSFKDYLSALLTADYEVYPDDTKHRYRQALRDSFGAYGILPESGTTTPEPGIWEAPDDQDRIVYDRTHFESMQRDPDEVFRFIWENRDALKLHPEAYTRVLSVLPCTRIAVDGFTLTETVAQYYQSITVRARELWNLRVRRPEKMHKDEMVTLYGGGALVFDEHGRLKYHVRNRILNREKQASRLQHLFDYGFYDEETVSPRHFSEIHRQRILGAPANPGEEV